MTAILPLVYSLILFLILSFLAFYLVGQVQQTQQVEQRLETLEKRIANNPCLAETYYFLGQIYLGKKDYPKSLRLLKNGLNFWNSEDRIGLGSLYNTLGFTYFKLQDNQKAIEYYHQAIQILPDYTLALNNLGLAYETTKQYKNAYATYRRVLAYDAQNPIAFARKQAVEPKLGLDR